MITIIAFFTNNGTPATGLAPFIKIREVATGTLVVAGESADVMIELGDGWYKYNFDADESKDYAIICDGGDSLTTAERYVFAGTELRELSQNIELVKQAEFGRWKIDATTKQLIFYKEDNITEIARFDLYNLEGTKAITNVIERKRT
ncbi:MAG: hypothetical protein ACTSPD_09760 [Promethearchaeota archaeon]